MSRALQVAVALSFLCVIVAFTHGYIYHRLVKAPQWSLRVRRPIQMIIIALGVLIPLGFIGTRTLPRSLSGLLSYVAFGWLGVLLFLMLAAAAADLFRIGIWMWSKLGGSRAPDMERRRVLGQAVTASVTGAAALGSAVAVRRGLAEVDVKEVEVALERLPPSLEGLTVVQLSDVHVGPTIGARFVDQIVEKARALKPDVVALTGDFVDGDVTTLAEHVAPLARLRGRFGEFFVTGNHEFYSGAPEWKAHFRRLGFRVLENEFAVIGDAGGRIQIAGIDDHTRTGGSKVGERLGARLDVDLETVLLAHQPRSIDQAQAMRAGLQVSGHTHGGQIYPFTELVRLTTPYVAGLYRHSEQTQIYVSRGTGYWGPPMRLAAPAEITKIVLTRA